MRLHASQSISKFHNISKWFMVLSLLRAQMKIIDLFPMNISNIDLELYS